MSNILACYQLLELNLISAQDLAPVGRSMRTYAVAWIDPDRKLSTRVDSEGGVNPTWNDKFVFRVDEEFIYDDMSAITIDIYALHWFKDIHVGTAQVLTDDLVPPPTTSRPFHNNYKPPGMRLVGVQVHRPSGRPKGILNVGVAVLDNTMRSMPLYKTPAVGYHHDDDDHHHHNEHDNNHQAQPKPELRRTKSDTSSVIGPEALAHKKRASAKEVKGSSDGTRSEVSTKSKSKKKGSSILSGSDVRPKTRKGRSGTTKKGAKGNSSPETATRDYGPMQHGMGLRMSGGYEVKPSPRPQFRNSPAMAYNNQAHNGLNNNINRGTVRATPMHAFATRNAALEYGTPYRSNLGRPMMTDSELGPSASEVAAAVAWQPVNEEGENSTVGGWSLDESVEGFQPKIERWRTELPPLYDGGEMTSSMTKSSKKLGWHARRHTDGGDGNKNGLFSCFSVICGLECSIVCGGDSKKNRRNRAHSVDDASAL